MKTAIIAHNRLTTSCTPVNQRPGLGQIGRLLALGVVLFAAMNVRAASGTWTNAPVDNTWANINNWVGKAALGALNQIGNSINNDVATFNSAIFGGIGGVSNPIKPDDATTNNDRGRTL